MANVLSAAENYLLRDGVLEGYASDVQAMKPCLVKSIFDDGVIAAQTGVHVSKCPYRSVVPFGSEAARAIAWTAGWYWYVYERLDDDQPGQQCGKVAGSGVE